MASGEEQSSHPGQWNSSFKGPNMRPTQPTESTVDVAQTKWKETKSESRKEGLIQLKGEDEEFILF